MPIIYTYPVKASPAADDLILISDSADSNKTKQVKVSALPSSGAGITLTTTGTSGAAELNGTVLNIPNYTTTGGTLSVQDSGGTVVAGIDTLNFNTDIAVVTTPGSSTATVNVSGGSGTPGGSDTQMQYNNGAAFGGTTGLTWDDSTNILSIATRYEGDINGAILQQVLVKEPGGVSKGDVVYISGGTGDNPEVRKAQANSISTMAALGIMKNSTAVDVVGECITSGEITGLNLTGFTTGDELFVSNTTAGGLLTSAPTGEANLVQKIGKVIKGGAGGALTVLGAFRTNATPNLNQGSLFIGDASNQTSTLAIGATRQTKAWKDNFGKLMRDDGTLVMDELSFMGVKASYKQTLAEVGIADFTDFEDEFTDMATGYETGDPVSAEEFQVRVDTVYAGVKDQIPEVEKLFRERYNLTLDQPTIFAALINPKIQDKVLAGEIATIQLQAQASSRGFTTSFARFDELRKMGLTAAQASQLYEGAGGMISQAASIGRDLSLETLEEATLGDELSTKRLQRISSELQSKQGIQLGSAKKGDEVTGLIAD